MTGPGRSNASPIEVIEGAYSALDAEDVPGFLALCDEAIVVRYPPNAALPYGGTWNGLDGAGRFLDAHDLAEEIVAFEPAELIGSGERVVALGHFRGTAKATGRLWETEFVHVFRVVDGRITFWQAFFDTDAAVAARRPSSPRATWPASLP